MADDDQLPDDRPELRPFAAWLQEKGNGALHSELSRAFADVVVACQEHGKGGTLTLKIDIKPDPKTGTLVITDDVVPKPPRPARQSALYWADERGNVSRNPPNQMTIPLREVGGRGTPENLREAQ